MDWIDSVLHVKRLFSVSYKTVLDRLIAEGLADSGIHRAFVSAYNNRYDGRLVFREESETYPARSIALHFASIRGLILIYHQK